jgi:uncharacterized protein (DUF433 family)
LEIFSLILLNATKIKNTMNWQEIIISDKEVLLGKPIIKDTRISVEHIVGLLAQGWSEKQILENYPRLSIESLKAVFAYLQQCLLDGLLFSPIQKSA